MMANGNKSKLAYSSYDDYPQTAVVPMLSTKVILQINEQHKSKQKDASQYSCSCLKSKEKN